MNQQQTLLWSALMLSFSTNTGNGFKNRIIGGTTIDITSFPYQVSIDYADHEICGGTIISRTVILTAAHCLFGFLLDFVTVRVGSSSWKIGGIIHNIRSAIIHENYRRGIKGNDIAVIFLVNPITLNNKAQIIQLATQAPEAGTMAWVFGFGSTFPIDGRYDDQKLRFVQVPVLSFTECQRLWAPFGGAEPGMLCAGVPGMESCLGDSGGPLVSSNSQIGIVSWGSDCGKNGVPSIYTDVAFYRQWIKYKTGV